MRLGLIVLSSLLVGCAAFDAPPQPTIKRATFTLHVYEGEVPSPVLGEAQFFEGLEICIVKLKQYPVCLLHEIRHCIEGAWHDERPNNEDC
jgi:hypothetical protein